MYLVFSTYNSSPPSPGGKLVNNPSITNWPFANVTEQDISVFMVSIVVLLLYNCISGKSGLNITSELLSLNVLVTSSITQSPIWPLSACISPLINASDAETIPSVDTLNL